VLIRLALAVIAAVIACNLPHSLIPMFKASVSEATPPPEIHNILAGKRKIVTVGDSITEAGKHPGGYVLLLQRYLSAVDPDRKIEIVNAGISGNKATDMQGRFQKDAIAKTKFIEEGNYMVVLMGGHLDVAHRRLYLN
jgi:lysophospholipase L1-like esterase